MRIESLKRGFTPFLFALALLMAFAPAYLEVTYAGLHSHDPIYIDGNEDFTPANGVTSGSGTENDPYIIENWDIRTEPWEPHFTTVIFGPTDAAGPNTLPEPPPIEPIMYCGRWVAEGLDAIVFFKFDLAGNIPAGATITQATLYFFIDDFSCEGGILLIGEVSDDTWEEETIGWANKPDLGPVIAEVLYPPGGSGWVPADVTSYIWSEFEGDGIASLWVYSAEDMEAVRISSKESSHPPCLKVTYADPIPTAPGIEICNTSVHFVVRNCDVVHDGYADYTYGICFHNVINGKIDNNHVWNYDDGIYLDCSFNNTIANNTCSNNYTGIRLYGSDNNLIYHNNFVNNSTHAYDGGTNYWDDGYPSGGNYWGDYAGVDENHGPNQDIPGPDGIGDTPYNISGGANQDRYPLMNPWPLVRGVEVSISPSSQSGLAGENLTYTVTVRNEGNVEDTFDLSASDNEGWGPILDNGSLSIPAGEIRTTALTVPIPKNAVGCTDDNITVTATSQADPSVSNNASCIAHAVSKAEFSLATLYKVNLDVDLWLDNGSKLVVKFYDYGDAFENENVIKTFVTPPPQHVEENEHARHPGIDGKKKGVRKARLVLTTDDTEKVIATIENFTVCKADLEKRFMEIPRKRFLAPTLEEKEELEIEFMEIPRYRFLTPC